MSNLHVAVIFDTRFGTTEKVAEAIVRGVRRVAGVEAELDFAPDVRTDVLERADLIVIGGPTEYLSASSHLREFFGRIGAFDLHEKFGYAFDTHAARGFSGSAARYIEREMKRLKLTLLEPRASALVESGGNGPGSSPLHLAAGTDARFEHIGETLGHDLLAAMQLRRKTGVSDLTEPGWAD